MENFAHAIWIGNLLVASAEPWDCRARQVQSTPSPALECRRGGHGCARCPKMFRNVPLEGTADFVIGDRLLTDVVFGNLHGCLTVHTGVLTLEGDNSMAKCIRPLEDLLFLRLLHRWAGVQPPPHLIDAAHDLVKG
eukprot:GGOE01057136.1.p1 GENE.GGOE01057136.1~~GGOE01057136.1.p1  ORF type:complete len:136 (+),score=13.36 GGOE01057136.1:70-477(+)